jgi:hypothetical protein
MANLSSHTAIYVRTTGNDTTGNGSSGSPYATAQKAFDIAVATPSGDYVLDFGAGSFGGVTLTQDWPLRIAVRGVGPTQSFMGGITGSGENIVYDYENYVTLAPPTNGRNVSLASDLSINVGNISVAGGNNDVDGLEPAGNGGLVTITECVGLLVNSSSGTGGGATGNQGINMLAGDVTLAGSNFGDITATGGNGSDYMSGSGGDVETTNSTTGNINCSGGDASYSQGSGGDAGEVTVSNSTTGNITCSGGYGSSVGGDAGEVVITNSTCGSISTIGGCTDYDAFKVGGNITLTNSTTGDLNSSAAACGSRGAIISAYVNAGGVFLGGTLTLVGGTILPNNIKVGRIIATNWSRGRGVNGSSILGIL